MLLQFAGPVFQDISTSEIVFWATILGLIFYLLAFLLPALLIAVIFNATNKVPKGYRKNAYKKFVLTFSVMFLTFLGYWYLEWKTEEVPLYPFFIIFWVVIAINVIEKLKSQHKQHSKSLTKQ